MSTPDPTGTSIRRRQTIGLLMPLERILRRFSPFEWLLFLGLLIILFASSLTQALTMHNQFLIEIPAKGGVLREGVVGLPRSVNPLLPNNDVERDLIALIYSGLLKPDPSGTLVTDLAERYEISEDGLVYTFTLRDDLTFHDGEPLTADDVLFTISKAQDPTLRSPKRANWDGVLAQKIDEHTISFTLKQPYAPFLENATIGILPAHIWKEATTESFSFSKFNQEPVGSGPYRVQSVGYSSSGVPTEYRLRAYTQSGLATPFITSLVMRFYPNADALLSAYTQGEVDSMVATPDTELAQTIKEEQGQIFSTPLSRLFAVFFNQNQNKIFADASVRKALDTALDKERIVKEVLFGYGSPIDGPLPLQVGVGAASSTPKLERLKEAKAILEKGGWEYSTETRAWEKTVNKETQKLSFALATGNAEELKRVAERIRDDWQALGVPVDLQFYETADLQQSIIRPRKYDALLFGLISGRELDLFAFWHSSQRNDPGLNIGMYANITTDKLLEEARSTIDTTKRNELLHAFDLEIQKDMPAVFVYTPDFVYAAPKSVKNISFASIVTPSDRFQKIRDWHINTERVWSFFK